MLNKKKQEHTLPITHKSTLIDSFSDHSGISRRTVLGTGLGLAVVGTGVGTWLGMGNVLTHADKPGKASDTVALQWNNAALQAISNTNTGSSIGARALAIVHTCMFDAWATYDSVAVPTQQNGIYRQSDKSEDMDEAVSHAAYQALNDLLPAQTLLFQTLMKNLGYDPNDVSTDTRLPSGVGNVAAQAVLAYRHSDGSNQLGDLYPGAYSDYTGYTPVNDPDHINDPNHWQPLRTADGLTQKFLTPHWGKVKPFALSSGAHFRPAGPATASQDSFKAQVDAILQLSTNLTDSDKVSAEYWSGGPYPVTSPGQWGLFSPFVSAQYVSRQDKHDLSTDIKMFFALANAIFDASIACWDCKRYYDSVRPITATHYLYAGQRISAWGGPGQGTQSIDGGTWISYLPTPPAPEYVSENSTFSAAGAYILTKFNGDTFGNTYTAGAGSSSIEPGITPAQPVTLSWPTFTDLAIQAGLSGRYGGIHFQQADEDGRTLGYHVAPVTWTKAQNYINGTGN